MSISTTTALWRARLRYWVAGRRQVTLRLLGRASDSSDDYLRIAEALAQKHEASGISPEKAVERGLVEALEILTEDGSPQVAAALKADGPRMLAERRRLDRGFEKRLLQRWGSALDLCYMIAVACQEVGAEGYQEANRCDEGSENERAEPPWVSFRG